MKTFCVILTALIFSAPAAVINPLLPFAILLLLYPLYRLALMRFIGSPRHVNGGFMAAAVLLIPILILASMVDGGGFAVGPFYAEDFVGDFRALKPSGSVAYGPGQLVAYEGDKGHGPVLAYVERGVVRWASELKTGDDPALAPRKVVELEVQRGILRDRVDFFALGTSEPGWAYVYKTGGVQKFYLKMF